MTDYFTVFGLPRKLAVDGPTLSGASTSCRGSTIPIPPRGRGGPAGGSARPRPRWSTRLPRPAGSARAGGVPDRAGGGPGVGEGAHRQAQGAAASCSRRCWRSRRRSRRRRRRDSRATPAPGSARSGPGSRSALRRRGRRASSGARRTGTGWWTTGATATPLLEWFKQRLATRAYLRTVIDDLSDALGEREESHVSHRRHRPRDDQQPGRLRGGRHPAGDPGRGGATPAALHRGVGPANGVVVGEAARRQLAAQRGAHRLLREALMGRGFEDVRDELARLPFAVDPAGRRWCSIRIGDREVTPPEVSALVLRELKQRAEAALRRARSSRR